MEVTQEEKNKYLAGWLGIKYYEDNKIYPDSKTVAEQALLNNPDYFTATERQVLLEWSVKQKWWCDFKVVQWLNYEQEGLSEDLLIPVTALAEALYKYLKEREG